MAQGHLATASELEKLRRLYAAWAQGDFAHTEIFDPDVISSSYGIWPGGETETRGIEEVAAATSGWLEQWERPFVIEAQEFVEEGERLAVVVRWKGVSRGGGAPIESENTHLWEFREGRAVRFDVYRDREQALAALHAASDLEKLRGLYADWARGDYSRTEIFDPEVEMRGYGWPEDMQADSLEELGEVMGGWFESWQRPAVVEAEDFIEQGGRIAVLIRWKGRGKESGTPMESEGAHLWRFRDGRAVHYEVYRDRDQALAALRESGDGDH